MKDLNKIKIIGIDHGYGNIKTANTVTPTGVLTYDTEPTFADNVLEYGGKFYKMGEGHKAFLADKCEDSDYYICTLMAIARELYQQHLTEADVHIAAGLPLTWVRSQREEFRSYLTKNSEVEFAYNGRNYKIRIVGCSIFPQGYAAVLDRIPEMRGVNILADIGNGTMNIMFIKNRKPVESQSYTETLGVNQLVVAAKNAVLNEYQKKLDDSVIEQIIRYGSADVSQKYLEIITRTAREYCVKIFETLAKYDYDSEQMRLFVVGGGGCIVKHFGQYDNERVTIIEDICATAKGYELLALSILKAGGGS